MARIGDWARQVSGALDGDFVGLRAGGTNVEVDDLRRVGVDISPGYRAKSRWRSRGAGSASRIISKSEREVEIVWGDRVHYEISLAPAARQLHRVAPTAGWSHQGARPTPHLGWSDGHLTTVGSWSYPGHRYGTIPGSGPRRRPVGARNPRARSSATGDRREPATPAPGRTPRPPLPKNLAVRRGESHTCTGSDGDRTTPREPGSKGRLPAPSSSR